MGHMAGPRFMRGPLRAILASRAFVDACAELRQESLLDYMLLGHCNVKGVLQPLEIYQLTPVMLSQRKFPALMITDEDYESGQGCLCSIVANGRDGH